MNIISLGSRAVGQIEELQPTTAVFGETSTHFVANRFFISTICLIKAE